MSARSHVADVVEATGFRVIPAPVDLDAVTAPTVVLYREKVEPSPAALGKRLSTLAVWVLDPRQDPRAAEDPLDASLDDVLAALDSDASLAWAEAERGTYADKWPAYRITLTIIESR